MSVENHTPYCVCVCVQVVQHAAGGGRGRENRTGDNEMSRATGETHPPTPTHSPLTLTTHSQPHHPFEKLLRWDPRDAAEQLCIIDSALYSRVDRE